MRILITGGSGFIGRALVEALLQREAQVVILSRSARAASGACSYVQSLDDIPSSAVFDAVVNLAGASLAGRRWNQDYKEEILRSRLDVTAALVGLLERLDATPPVLLSASAVGFYGHHDDAVLTEAASPEPGFAQALCAEWEQVALRAQALGVRVCLLRLGVVLDRGDGALLEMARSFRFGVASWLGHGRQWLSWVHRADVVAAILFLLSRPDLSGPFNLSAPEPVTGREFCRKLKAHHRTLITAGVPAPVVRLLVGGMADELLLRGQRVIPTALENAGFRFRFPDLPRALAAIYGDQTRLRSLSPSG